MNIKTRDYLTTILSDYIPGDKSLEYLQILLSLNNLKPYV